MQYLEHLDDSHRSGVLELISAATNHDGVPPIAEHVVLHLRHGGDISDSHIIVCEGPTVVGYAHLDLTDEVEGPSVEIVIHPKYRGKGFAQEILTKAKEVAGIRMRLWAHGDVAAAKELALHNGFKRIRTVIQMRRSLIDALPEVDPSVQTRTCLPGLDDEEWLALNNRAFIDHPDQSKWDLNDLTIRLHENWFDPTGFFIATDKGIATAFCWTKIHGGHSHSHEGENEHHDHDPIGEIYIMGVDPAYAGRGLGKALTLAGLRYLRQNGIFSAMLYVDSDNEAALRLYKSLGFTEFGRDVLYRLDTHQLRA